MNNRKHGRGYVVVIVLAVVVALTLTSILIVDKNTVIVDDTLLAADVGDAAAGDVASGYAPVADADAPAATSKSKDDDAAAAPSDALSGDRAAKGVSGVAGGEEAATSPDAVVADEFEGVSGGAVAVLGNVPSDTTEPVASDPAVTPGAHTAATSGGAATDGGETAPATPVTDDNSTTSPAVKAVKSLSLDADELLFGKLGVVLKLKAKPHPKDADASDMRYESSDESVAVVASNGAVTPKGWGKCVVTLRSGNKKATCKVTVAKKWVALTFDDGPGKYTDKLLKAMKKQDVRATFFVVGQMAKPRADLLKKMVKNGNEVANHTYAHNGSEGALMNGLNKTDKIVKKAIGKKTVLMRPPGGAINSVTRRCGKPIILWSVDPKDWRDRNANTVYNRVMDGTKSGGIVLLHDIHPTSVDAAIKIMKALEKKGYAFVTVSELLGDAKDNKVYNKGPKKVRTMKIRY